MKERFVTLGLALGAFALFYALFVPKPANEALQPALPVSTELREDGYQGLWRWLGAQEIRTLSYRDRYDRLKALDIAGSGNLMIATLPQREPARRDELDALDKWLDSGNTLLLVAALNDTPAWARAAGDGFLVTLNRLAGLGFTVIDQKPANSKKEDERVGDQTVRRAVQAILQAQRGSIIARGAHPLLAGVRSVATESTYPASRWLAHASKGALLLELADRSDHAPGRAAPEPALWLRRHGQGQVIVLAFASPFTNGVIGRDDNARLFANIVAWSVANGGAVLFDDAHQGVVNYYDGKAFFSDARLHRTLLWICALWLMFVLGWQRLRPRETWNPVDITTFIKVTGGFLAGRVAVNATGRRLFENFFNRIRQRLALPQDGLPVWDWLAAQATVPAGDLARLRQLHARAQGRQRVDLVLLQNCLTTITGKLL